MLFKNKKGQVAKSVVLWVFTTFTYFAYGYEIVKVIVGEVFLPNNPTGIMYALGLFAPFVPVLGLMFWGYTILNEDGGGGGIPQ